MANFEYSNYKEEIEKKALTEEEAVKLVIETHYLEYELGTLYSEKKKLDSRTDAMRTWLKNQEILYDKGHIKNLDKYMEKLKNFGRDIDYTAGQMHLIKRLISEKSDQIAKNTEKIMEFIIDENTIIKNERNKQILTEFKEEHKNYLTEKEIKQKTKGDLDDLMMSIKGA